MKAIIAKKYGPPEQLQLLDIPKPSPKPGEVLVKVIAAAVNDFDWGMVTGKPDIYRLIFGFLRPKREVIGIELSGLVEAVGDGVRTLAVGDAVYGDISRSTTGAFAEYCCVPAQALIKKPKSMSFEEAAALSHASMLAWQAMVKLGQIKRGDKVLINGAGGGVGTIGLQIAKQYEVEVTGVDTGSKLEMMKSLGFDHTIYYKQQDFTHNGQTYDLIIDAKTTRAPAAYLRSLAEGGRYVTVGGKISRLLQLVALKGFLGKKQNKRLKILALDQNKGLEQMHQLYEAKQLKLILDGPYPLEKTPWAIRYFGEGLHQGKVVIRVGEA
ncbi:MAG: NAD(P)-dependent alcohol dehydrogenase [Saprospiraceae bacterium]|nr:NAD(P)-dependent alcohol dehydrogenase [Saprospiraceae bacterium]